MTISPEELAWRRDFSADRSASDLVREMSRLRSKQPRSLLKLYRNPTPEQRAAWDAVNKQYNRMMSHLRKAHKIALARDNARFRSGGVGRTRRRELIPGGLAPRGRCPRDVLKSELRKGIKVEMEHTRSRRVAREIACDHLTEDRRYYTKLARIHRE